MNLDYLDAKQRAVLEELHPELRAGIERVLARLDERFIPICGYRSGAVQLARFKQGREVTLDHNGRVLTHRRLKDAKGKWLPVVTNAMPMASPHNYKPALAVDVVLNTKVVKVGQHPDDPRFLFAWETRPQWPEAIMAWQALGVAVEHEGLEWGGRFKPMVDRPHVQLANWRRYLK